jgi:RNA polymerase sigma factor (sigma-70 family)
LLDNAMRVRRFFIRRLRDSRQDADDLTQEVCARFLSIQEWASVDDADRYLFGIARHVLADFLAQRRKRQEVSFDSVEGMEDFGVSDVVHDPAVAVGNADLLSILLRRLPVSQRAVLIAHEGVGYSYREVASRLGFTEQTVETYLKCAKAHLRSLSISR